MIKRLISLIITMSCLAIVSGCAMNNDPEFAIQPEKPWLQQYYQVPGPYYTAPPPQLEYWDPRQDPVWQSEYNAVKNKRDTRQSIIDTKKEN